MGHYALKKYEEIKHRFPIKTRWTRKNLAERAEEVQSASLYRMLYSTLSGFIHSDIRAIIVHSDLAAMNIEPAPSKKWVVLRQNTIRSSTATQHFAMGLIQKSTTSPSGS